MKKLVAAFVGLLSAGVVSAQEEGIRGMEVIDSLILTTHHYDPRVVKVDTQYTLQSKKVSEHYFIDTTTQGLERAVVQVYHSPERSTIEYYFFLDNALARVQSQEFSKEGFSETRIHYFDRNRPLDCKKKEQELCAGYVQKATGMLRRFKYRTT
jgi:hypothetical protein